MNALTLHTRLAVASQLQGIHFNDVARLKLLQEPQQRNSKLLFPQIINLAKVAKVASVRCWW